MERRKIEFIDEADFLKQSGLVFLDELRVDGTRSSAPESVRRDWSMLANWIDYKSGEFSSEQAEKLVKAWKAYLAIGIAPSLDLQPNFTHFSKQIHDVNAQDRAPVAIMDVFDRLLATDEKIAAKRAADLRSEEERLRPIFAQGLGAELSWWRSQSSLVRNWIFASVTWAATLLIYAFFFDPFDTGGWDSMNDREVTQLTVMLLTPFGAGLVFHAYRKWV